MANEIEKMNEELHETRKILEEFAQKNYATNDAPDVQLDAKTAQERESERIMAEEMKPQIS